MTDSINTLGETAVKIAANAAHAWFAQHSAKPVSLDAFCECLKANVKVYLPGALRDAREALEAGMYEVGQQTFAASMALAGIDAAKECATPR